MNDMEITEYLNKENCIEIAIYNKVKKTYTEIKINNYYQDNNIKIVIENNDDLIDNNSKVKKNKNRSGKNSKSKEQKNKDKNKMEIEEEYDKEEKKKENNDENKLPSIEINSEDTEDSMFLNTLFNSIFV